MSSNGSARRTLDSAWERLFGPDIFITYTRRDGETYALALKKALSRRYLVFLDTDAIKGGERFEDRIKKEIRRCRLHVVVLTPDALDVEKAPWIFQEAGWHFSERRTARILTIFFPPNSPENVPAGLRALAEHKGALELPGAEKKASASIRLLEAIAAGEGADTVDAIWREGVVSSRASKDRKHPVREIDEAFDSVRQRTRMQQAAVLVVILALFLATGWLWSSWVSNERLGFAQKASQAETDARHLEAERNWLAAARIAPWGRDEFTGRWQRARASRLLTPAAKIQIPPGWSLRSLGTRGNGDWCLFVYRMHDNDAANGQAAIIDRTGWLAMIPIGDDFTPVALFHDSAVYVYAAGRVSRIDLNSPGTRISAELDFKSHGLNSINPTMELGWKAGKLHALAGKERPPFIAILDPASLRVERMEPLQMPITFASPDDEAKGADTDGEAIVRLSTRADRTAVGVWRRFAPHDVGLVSWDLSLKQQTTSRDFALPMNEIGRESSINLGNLELSAADTQIFLNFSTYNFPGSILARPGQSFWLAVDTETNRPPLLMDSGIEKLWPLPAHQRIEAYYTVGGNDLRALTFIDFIVLARPAQGVLSDVRAAALLSPGDTSLVAANAHDVVLIRDAKPVFRIAAPLENPSPYQRLHRIVSDATGAWVAATVEQNSETEPQQIFVWRAGSPSTIALPTLEELRQETACQDLRLSNPPDSR